MLLWRQYNGSEPVVIDSSCCREKRLLSDLKVLSYVIWQNTQEVRCRNYARQLQLFRKVATKNVSNKIHWPQVRSISRWDMKKFVNEASMYAVIHWSSLYSFSQQPCEHLFNIWSQKSCCEHVGSDKRPTWSVNVGFQKLKLYVPLSSQFSRILVFYVIINFLDVCNLFRTCSKTNLQRGDGFLEKSYLELQWIESCIEASCTTFVKIHLDFEFTSIQNILMFPGDIGE